MFHEIGKGQLQCDLSKTKLFSERATSSGLSTVEGFQKCISIVQESIKVAERKKRAIQLTIANSPMNKSSTGVATSK